MMMKGRILFTAHSHLTNWQAGRTNCAVAPAYAGHCWAARETQTISLSLRTYIDLLAKAGCDHRTVREPRPDSLPVGARMCARLISSYPFGVSRAMMRSPFSLNRKKRSPFWTRKALAQR